MRPIKPRVAYACLAVVAGISVACGEGAPTAADIPPSVVNEDIRVSVDEQSVELWDTGSSVQGTVTAAITNTSAERVTYGPCGNVLERETAGEWRVVWNAVCRLVDRPPEWIAPGATLSTEVEILSFPPYPQVPTWSRPIDGTYRLRVALGNGGGTLPTEVGTSNEFDVSLP